MLICDNSLPLFLSALVLLGNVIAMNYRGHVLPLPTVDERELGEIMENMKTDDIVAPSAVGTIQHEIKNRETQHDKAEKSSDKTVQHSDQADKHLEFDQQMLELNDALEELSVRGKNTDDYALMALAKLVEKAASLCANATGVAGMAVKAMLALGGGLIKKPESPELKAIKELNKVMVRKFAELRNDTEDMIKHVQCEVAQYYYNENVKAKVDSLQNHFKQVFDTNNAENEHIFKKYKENFVHTCDGLTGEFGGNIVDTLDYISREVIESCPMPAEGSSPRTESEKICKPKPGQGYTQQSCFLKQVIEGNKERREPLLYFAITVQQHLIQLQIMISFCSEFSQELPEIKQRTVEQINKQVVDIAQGMLNWIQQRLEVAWPEIIAKGSVEEVINTGDVREKEQTVLDNYAEKIANEAVSRGPLNAGYQVFLWRHNEDDDDMTGWQNLRARCELTSHCFSIHYNNLQVYIVQFRLDQAQVERLERAREWMDTNRQTIQRLLTKDPNQQRATFEKDLPGIMDRISANAAGLNDHFGTQILMVRCKQFFVTHQLRNHYGWAQAMSVQTETKKIASALTEHKFGYVHSEIPGEWRDFVLLP